MKGKEKCRILKQIRRQIAEQNDIAYITSECKHQGDCSGTCPKCEQELRELERELEKRQKAGKTVAVAGIAAALMVASVGCGNGDTAVTAQTVQPSVISETTTAGVPEAPEVDMSGSRESAETEELPVIMGDVIYEESAP